MASFVISKISVISLNSFFSQNGDGKCEFTSKWNRAKARHIFGAYGILALVKYTIMTKPIKSLEYPMIQFLINIYIYHTMFWQLV